MTSTDEYGFKRLWRMPAKALHGASLQHLTPRNRYLIERSKARFAARPDALWPSEALLLSGQIGRFESVRLHQHAPRSLP